MEVDNDLKEANWLYLTYTECVCLLQNTDFVTNSGYSNRLGYVAPRISVLV